mgnify:CR=1 FL=1|tara:strand:+ start:368 stop:604 length:237 start_codon:yes stop_codon:yes gene_type:complete
METVTVEYNGFKLTVTGYLINGEPENNITAGFEATDIFDDLDQDIFSDFLEDDLQDIEALAFKKVKDNNQSGWEVANV